VQQATANGRMWAKPALLFCLVSPQDLRRIKVLKL
jgi:hypothetical protein